MNEYLNVFIDNDYPIFINKYLNTKTMQHLKNVTQFCGADYSGLYNTKFLYTRYDHSIVVALITWHFTHDKKETIKALLHDAGTPCFAHCIDYVFGDYIKQESSERKISDVVSDDECLLKYLKEDGIEKEELDDLTNCPILENKSPKLCADRLDGVLHTCYIWLHTDSIEKIKDIYQDMIVLINEDGKKEMGFSSLEKAEEFVRLTATYAKELRGNTDKFVMKYISELVKESVSRGLITLDDLYTKKESEICDIFDKNFPSWKKFIRETELERTEEEPIVIFWVSFKAKLRNTIPLVNTDKGPKRINEVSDIARKIYGEIEDFKDSKYAYVKSIKSVSN